MKKTYQLKPTPSEEGRRVAAEIYTAPPPPTKGRVIGLDCHPDTYTAAVYQGSTPHDARKLTSRENLCLQGLLEWAAKEFTRDDLFLMEAGSNSFEIHRRLLSLGLRAVVLESCHVGKHAKTYADNDKMAATNSLKGYLNQFAIRTASRGLQLERTRQWILAQRDWTTLQKELLAGYFAKCHQQGAFAREK